MESLSFQLKLLLPPRFKICKKCGAICETSIRICPGFIPNSRIGFLEKLWRKLLRRPKNGDIILLCENLDFKEVTSDIAKVGVKIYFKSWPKWPSEGNWHQISARSALEKTPKN